jgi:hypothetical protein
VLAQPFEILNGVLERIVFESALRSRSATAALVEEKDTEYRGIEKLALLRGAGAARAALHDDERNARGIPALLDEEFMPIADVDPAFKSWLRGR